MAGNLLQMLAGGYSDPVQIMSATDMNARLGNTMQPQTIQPPKPRMSLLETIGRISDVIARVGGADALYQPTIDAREDRMQQIDLDAMRKTLLEQQIGAGTDAATERGNAVLGSAVRGLQAIQARGGDISKAWPILARQAGIPDDRAMALGNVFAQNPDTISAIASMAGEGREFGLQPFYAQGPDGQLRAYQIGKDGTVQPIQLGEGEVPIDPLKFVDTGGQQVGVGSRSGSVRRILPNTVDPNTRANIGSRERIATAGNASRERVAATKGRSGEDSTSVAAILQDFNVPLDGNVDPVADLIAGSTSGQVENIASMIPGAFGHATSGQENIGRLETIDNAIVLALAGGKLGAGVSNADRDFFKSMSGKISDPNTPADKRLAAWQQIKSRLRGIVKRESMPRQNAPRQNTPRPRRTVTPAPRNQGNSGWGKATVVGN